MPIQDQESRIILALEAIRSSKKISISQAATLYSVPKTTLRDRKNGKPSRGDLRPNCLVLDDLEEEVLCKYILDLDDRGFAPGLAGVNRWWQNYPDTLFLIGQAYYLPPMIHPPQLYENGSYHNEINSISTIHCCVLLGDQDPELDPYIT